MSIPISWAKTWSSSDDGTYLHGSDLAAIQSDIATALTSAVSLNGNLLIFSSPGILSAIACHAVFIMLVVEVAPIPSLHIV